MYKYFFVFSLLIACTGCAGISIKFLDKPYKIEYQAYQTTVQTEERKSPGGAGIYFKDRINDFVDIFGFSLSVGFGVQANVRATQIIQAGGLFWGGSRFGFIGREGGGWSETVTEFGFPGMYIRSVQIIPGSGNIEPVNTERGQSFWIFCGDEGKSYDEDYDRKFWQVGATVHAGIIGVDFSLNLQELLDFLLGWTTLDISKDDTANKPKPEKKQYNRYRY